MDNQTKKFRDKIKEEKESQESQAEQIIRGYGSFISILVGISQASLIYISYYILSTKIPSMIKFNYWEGMAIIFGVLSFFTVLRNHIKTLFNK